MQRILVPIALAQLFLVGLQPVSFGHLGFLIGAHGADVILNGALSSLLIAGDDGQLDVVAVLRLGRRNLAGQLAVAVLFHDAGAGTGGDVLCQPAFHAGLDAVLADGIGQLIALRLQLAVIGFIGRDGADIADDLRGQGAARINALGADLDGKAIQHHAAAFDLRYRGVADVLGDDHRQRIVQVHLHFIVDGHHLEHRFLVGNLIQLRKLIAAVQELIGDLGIVVFGLGDIVVAAPLLAAGVPGSFGNTVAKLVLPHAVFIAADYKIHAQLAAVLFDDLNGLDDGLGVIEIIGLFALGGVAIKGDVINVLRHGQDDGIRVGNHTALAGGADGFDALSASGIGVALALDQLKLGKPVNDIGEGAEDDQQRQQNAQGV